MGSQEEVHGGRLGHVKGDVTSGWIESPIIVSPQKPFNGPHKVDAKLGLEGRFKPLLHSVANAKVSHIVHVAGNVDRWMTRDGDTHKDTWGMGAREKAHVGKYLFQEFVPVTGTAA